MAKIKIDREKCIGCGSCESVAGKLFAIKDGKAMALKSEVKGEDEKKAKEAEEICPVQAISVK